MTTTTDVFAGRHAVLDRTERAQEAVKVFRTMQPQLSGFARAITGRREVKVVLDTGTPRTDGKSIYYRPPITLGDKYKHDRSLCEKRGADKVLLCLACAQREAVLAVIYHEIAHIAFDSFDPPTDEQRKDIITRAVGRAEGKRAEGIMRRIESSPYWKTDSYLGLATIVSEYLPFIVNCLEDARVNREMFKARPGTRVMFETDAYRALLEGVEQGDGEVMQWKDYPLNAQVSVGLLCKAAGYEFGWDLLHPAVGRAMADKELTALVNRMDSVRSVSGVYELSLPVLQRLQDLGFCIDHPEDEPEPEPQPEGPSEDESEETDDGEGQPGDEGGQGGSPDEGEPDDPEGDEAAQDSGDAGSEPDAGDDDGASDGLDDGESGESGGDGSPGEDEEAAAGDAGGSDDGAADDGDGSGDAPADDEAGDECGEASTGTIGDDPEAGTGEAGSGDGTGGEAESSDGDASSDGESAEGTGNAGGSDEGADDGSQPDAGEASDGTASGDGAEEAGPEGAEGDAESGDSRGADAGADDSVAPEHAGDGSDKAASRSSVGDPSDDTPGTEEPADGDGDPRDGDTEEGQEPAPGAHDELDTGADAGMGGVEIEEQDEEPLPEPGDPSDAKKALKVFGGHEDPPATLEEVKDEEAINVAIVQGLYFEKPSATITGVRVHKFGSHEFGAEPEGWGHDFIKRYYEYSLEEIGVGGDTDIPESVLGPCLTRMRVAFADNKRNRMNPNLKSGRIRKQALGKRAWGDDERLFQKKTIAKKRDYMVVIGIDISGSTTGTNLILAKRAAMAQAELCHRLGVKFAVYAHTAQRPEITAFSGNLSLEMYEIKGADDPWSAKAKEAFAQIGPVAENLDGHSIEFYRKICDASTATDNIILYYTDGKMPAANHDEELEILRREIKTCKSKGYHLLGVGIRTDSPKRHGLDTVQVDDDEDLVNVVRHLEKRLV